MACPDSKALTEEKREALFHTMKVCELVHVPIKVTTCALRVAHLFERICMFMCRTCVHTLTNARALSLTHIQQSDYLGWKTRILSPVEISEGMLGRSEECYLNIACACRLLLFDLMFNDTHNFFEDE